MRVSGPPSRLRHTQPRTAGIPQNPTSPVLALRQAHTGRNRTVGTIVKRGRSWRAAVARRGVRDSATFATRQEAADWIVAREAEILAGNAATGRQTLASGIDLYAAMPGRSKWDRLRLAYFRAQPWAREPVSALTPATLAAWRDARLAVVKPGTVLREMTLLRGVLETARREWGWIDRNPIADVRRPPAPQPRKAVISDAQRDAMVAALGFDGERVETIGHETAVALLLALETAMRAGELLALTTADIDYRRQVATLHKSKTGPGREVPLSKRAIALLKILSAKRMLRTRVDRKGRLWHIDGQSLDATFRRARNAAGLSGFTFHDARRTALTRLSKIFHVLQLARISGHSDINELMTYYAEPMESIAERLD